MRAGYDLPTIPITEAERLWMEEVYADFIKGEETDIRVLKSTLFGKIPKDFNPDNIDRRLLTGRTELTLLGIWHVNPATDLVHKTDVVINCVRDLLIRDSNRYAVPAEEVASLTGIPLEEVGKIFKLLGGLGRFFSSRRGGVKGGYSEIFIEGETYFDAYYQYEGIERAIREAFNKLEVSNDYSVIVASVEQSSITSSRQDTASIDVFISHSRKDKDVAAALIELLRAALNIPSEKIRCTSVDGFRLPAGASTDEQLRQEIYEAKAFVGLLTPASLQSTYVLFELGARWGARLHLAPVLASGVDAETLRGPLTGLNALSCDVPAQVHQLISDIAATLNINTGSPSAYQKHIDTLVEQSRRHKEMPQGGAHMIGTAVSNVFGAPQGDNQRISKLVSKLENSLELMLKAFDFMQVITAEDLTSSSGNLTASIGRLRDMPYPLRAYLACEGDRDKLKGYIRELVEAVSRKVKGGVNIDLTLAFVFDRYSSPITDFNPEADRVFKEVDTQLGVVCKTLGLRFPGGGKGRYGGQRTLSSEEWFRSDCVEAVNILNAAKTILE